MNEIITEDYLPGMTKQAFLESVVYLGGGRAETLTFDTPKTVARLLEQWGPDQVGDALYAQAVKGEFCEKTLFGIPLQYASR